MGIDNTLYRQWSMLRLVPRHPRKISASELTTRLNELGHEINKRTVERDLKMFEDLFGLCVDDRTRPYGWQWGRDSTTLDIPSLDDGQALMLSIAEPFVAQLLPQPVLEAFQSLLAVARRRLKESVGSRQLRSWPDKIYSTPPAQPLMPARILPDIQAVVGMALLRDRWLSIRYRKRGASEATDFEIQPLGLVSRGPMLYLICRFRGQDDERTIALSRFEQVEMLAEGFQRPAAFSLHEFVEQGKMGFGGSKVSKVQLRISRKRGEQLAETPLSVDQVMIEEKGNAFLVTATLPITPQFRQWLLGFGDEVEVIEPVALREDLIRTIAAMQRRYGT